MGNGVHISQKSKVRRHQKKNEQEVRLVSGKYLHDFLLALTFTCNGKKHTKAIDFLPLFQQYVKGDNLEYFAPSNFKKFIINDSSISWGKNEDVIFPVSTFLNPKKNKATEKIIYVI